MRKRCFMLQTKRIFVFLLAFCPLILCACSPELQSAILNSLNTPMFLPSESKLHFDALEPKLILAAESFGHELKKVKNEADDESILIEYRLELDNSSCIVISFHNFTLDGRTKGEERFTVSYSKRDRKERYDVELFIALINSVSGRAVSAEFVQRVLSDTDGSFAELITRERSPENDWEGLVKFKHLDSSRNWSLSEEITKDERLLDAYPDLLYFDGSTPFGYTEGI